MSEKKLEVESHVGSIECGKKAASIVSGYLQYAITEKEKTALLGAAVAEFAYLLALITSPLKHERDAAKRAIRSYAQAGGWHMVSDIGVVEGHSGDVGAERNQEKKVPNRFRRWSAEELGLLSDTWTSPIGIKDSALILKLSETLERTPLAIISRLYQGGMISMEDGDEFCIALETAKVLSKLDVKKKVTEELIKDDLNNS